MKTCTKCGVEKPLSEFGKRSNRPCGIVGFCKACAAKRAREWQASNKERDAQRKKVWRESNSELIYLLRKQWFDDNPEKRKLMAKSYRARHPAKCSALHAEKRARKLRAEPVWADRAKMQEIYAACAFLTKETSIQHHVDHVIPLRSKVVCGLHNEFNLQILTAEDNQKKYNLFKAGS